MMNGQDDEDTAVTGMKITPTVLNETDAETKTGCVNPAFSGVTSDITFIETTRL